MKIEVAQIIKFASEIEPVTRKIVSNVSEHYWQYCVDCGTRLESRKCKFICPKCGFYHSCSEP